MDRAPGPSFAERMIPSRDMSYLEAMARLHHAIHGKPGTGLCSLKARLSVGIRHSQHLDAAARDRLQRQLAALPDDDRVCHGDFHPWNVHGAPGDVMVVDWLDAGSGHPAADVCRTYILIHSADPAAAMAYVEAYARISGLRAADILAWQAPVAAARLAENVPDETEVLLRLAGI